MSKQVDQAKKFLEDKGWQTYELWHIDNVKELYECDAVQLQWLATLSALLGT